MQLWRHHVSPVIPSSSSFLCLFHALFFLCFVCRFSGAQSEEVQILLRLKSAFQNYSRTNVFDSWTPGASSPCNFSGIFCDSKQSVIGVELHRKGLVGPLPFDSICRLQWLERLNLSSNSLHGAVTEHLQNCSKLQLLDLSVNSFSGKVPELASIRGLKLLRLNGNRFSGAFPWRSLENLTDLGFLAVGDNPFDKSPFPSEVLKLEKLYWLYLSNCSLEGRIPVGIGNLTELINVEFSDNHLYGKIPADIVKLRNLWQLELYDNDLSGKLPIGFGNLTNLVSFDASNNVLEGDLSELKSLTRLSVLQLFENQFSGEIPEEFGDFKNLSVISLYTNKLTGPLPQNLGSWSDFYIIDVSENYFSGSIPPNICKNGKMTKMLLIQNKFSGEIPATYANCSSLNRLRVSNNSLSGVVPAGIWGLPNLNFIDLALNQFEGPLTSDIANAKSLAQLRLQNNRFSGEIPPEISKPSSLVSIDMSYNQFSGEIPGSIGKLKQLNSLYLQQNILSGSVPDSLGACSSLNVMDLSRNSISGKIPDSIGSLFSLNSLNLAGNQLSGPIPDSLWSLKLSFLNLSNNRLTGPIPDSLSMLANNGSFSGNPGLCSQIIRHFPPCSSDPGQSNHIRTLISCFLSGTIFVLLSLSCFILIKKKQNNPQNKSSKESWNVKSFRRLSFTEREILNAIKQENLIGRGGSGNVYKVVLGNGREFAVKHIWNSRSLTPANSRSSTAMLTKRPGKQPEFEAEVATLSSIRHVNVVKLYCSISSEDSSLLVYEYMPNGNLWERLHSSCDTKLDWEKRYEIAVGAAKGLEYLHHGCDRPVVHRDVKSSNILLDESFKPRIADFGLAKIIHGQNDSTCIIAGTLGYIAPEYAYTFKVNEKSDVYSYGVVLMELVTGRKPIEQEFGETRDIVYWVYSRMAKKESVLDVVDSSIPESSKEDAGKMLRVAVLCTARLPALRPSMRTVVKMLEDVEPCRLIGITVTN